MRWNNLHYQYRKESRRPGGSTWPYFERLRFLSNTQLRNNDKSKSQGPLRPQAETLEVPRESLVDHATWQSYNDCVVMHVSEMVQQADNSFVIEEIIESNDQILQEEIIYEEDGQEQSKLESTAVPVPPSAVETQMAELIASPANEYVKMDKVLNQLKGNHKKLAERRIMAFLLKCQLRALVNESIDDLVI